MDEERKAQMESAKLDQYELKDPHLYSEEQIEDILHYGEHMFMQGQKRAYDLEIKDGD